MGLPDVAGLRPGDAGVPARLRVRAPGERGVGEEHEQHERQPLENEATTANEIRSRGEQRSDEGRQIAAGAQHHPWHGGPGRDGNGLGHRRRHDPYWRPVPPGGPPRRRRARERPRRRDVWDRPLRRGNRVGRWPVTERLWRANFTDGLIYPPEDRTPVHKMAPDDEALLLRGPDSGSLVRGVVLLRLAVLHGLRTSEPARLTWERVPHHGNGGCSLTVGHAGACVRFRWTGGRRRPQRKLAAVRRVGPVFHTSRGRPSSARLLLRFVGELRRRAGLEGVNFSSCGTLP